MGGGNCGECVPIWVTTIFVVDGYTTALVDEAVFALVE